jgi:hypothetical protein
MKRLIPLFLITLFFVWSCNESSNEALTDNTVETLKNDLIPDLITVRHLVHLDSTKDCNEVNVNVDYMPIFNEIIEKALSGELIVYDPDVGYEQNVVMEKSDIQAKLGMSIDTFMIEDPETFELTEKIVQSGPRKEEMRAWFFRENWLYNKEKNVFKKEVIAHDIVRKFYRHDDIDKERLEMALVLSLRFNVPNDSLKKGSDSLILLQENMVNEFSFFAYEGFHEEFNRELFWNAMMEKMKNEDIKMTDFETGADITISEIEKLPMFRDTFMVEDPITFELKEKIVEWELGWWTVTGYLFIEDWYYDPISYKVTKKVKGITPVIQRYPEEGEAQHFLFTLWFNE